jgi:hypothetical protein
VTAPMAEKTPAKPVVECANLKSGYKEYAAKYANFLTRVKVLMMVDSVALRVIAGLASIHPTRR